MSATRMSFSTRVDFSGGMWNVDREYFIRWELASRLGETTPVVPDFAL
jgi:hypothetical protein